METLCLELSGTHALQWRKIHSNVETINIKLIRCDELPGWGTYLSTENWQIVQQLLHQVVYIASLKLR